MISATSTALRRKIERAGPMLTPQALAAFARQARKRMQDAKGGYRRDLSALHFEGSRPRRLHGACAAQAVSP